MNTTDQTDYALDAKRPRIASLNQEYIMCLPGSGLGGVYGGAGRTAQALATRYAEWEGQSADLKKHSTNGVKAKPWENASDQRVFLADALIDTVVDTLTVAFWREMIQASAVNVDASAESGVARTVLRYLMQNKMAMDLSREVELSAQYTHTFGHSLIHVTWDREIGLRKREVTLEDVRNFSEDIYYAVNDPTREEEAMVGLGNLYEAYLAVEVAQLQRDEAPEVASRDLRRYVRELRTEGCTKVSLPYLAKNQPNIRALRPGLDCFMPEDNGDVQRVPVFVRELLRVDEVMARVRSRGWNREWAEEAIKTKGQSMVYDGTKWVSQSSIWVQAQYVEVVTAYTRRIDDDDIPGVYVTIYCPAVQRGEQGDDLVAAHGLLDFEHGLKPVIPLTTEWVARSITMARGIPERAAPAQRLMKVEQDSLIDRASITTLPPRLVPLSQAADDDLFGPAAVIPTQTGKEPKFMQLPQYDGVSEKVVAQTRQDVAIQFGHVTDGAGPGPNAPNLRSQRHLNTFLHAWTEVFTQVWQLCQQYISDGEFMKIVGVPKPDSREIAGRYGVMLAMDVRQLDAEYSLKELEAISQHVVPEDAGGMIDLGALIQMKLAALNPLLASRLVQTKQGASQKVYEGVAAEIASMFLGNPPKPVENDPTAEMQLQFAQQIVQANPKYQEALVSDKRFSALAKAWTANRMQSVAQQKNKMVGRLGVSPDQLQGAAT